MKRLLITAIITSFAFAEVGVVTAIKGSAKVQRDAKAIPMYKKMGLFKKDIVETKSGRLQMLFADNTVISLGKNSRFKIKEYFYEEDSKKAIASFELKYGFIKAITGKIGKTSPKLFAINTPATKVQPHGTTWYIEVRKGEEYYQVIEGSINLSFSKNTLQKEITVNAGQSITLQISIENPQKIINIGKVINVAEMRQNQNRLNYIGRENKARRVDRPIRPDKSGQRTFPELPVTPGKP